MYLILELLELLTQPYFPPPPCMFELRMGGMLVNFGPMLFGEDTLMYLSWIYSVSDPEAELRSVCASFLI